MTLAHSHENKQSFIISGRGTCKTIQTGHGKLLRLRPLIQYISVSNQHLGLRNIPVTDHWLPVF